MNQIKISRRKTKASLFLNHQVILKSRPGQKTVEIQEKVGERGLGPGWKRNVNRNIQAGLVVFGEGTIF